MLILDFELPSGNCGKQALLHSEPDSECNGDFFVGFPSRQNRMALSVITLLELAHGAAGADTPERKTKRQEFIRELMQALPVHQISPAIALRTGYIDCENQARGVRLPLADLLIGATALELGYDVATRNPRHFQSILSLSVLTL